MESSEHRIKFIEQNGAKSTVLSSEFRIEFRVQNRVQSTDESLRFEYNSEYRIMSELEFTCFTQITIKPFYKYKLHIVFL